MGSKRKARVVRERFTKNMELKRSLGHGKALAIRECTKPAGENLGRANAHSMCSRQWANWFDRKGKFFWIGDQTSSSSTTKQ